MQKKEIPKDLYSIEYRTFQDSYYYGGYAKDNKIEWGPWKKFQGYPTLDGMTKAMVILNQNKDFGQGIIFVYTYHNVPVFQEYQKLIFYDSIEQDVDFKINTLHEDMYYKCEKKAFLLVSSDRTVTPVNCAIKKDYTNFVLFLKRKYHEQHP